MSEQIIQPKHFLFSQSGQVATITLNRPERKNPLTFDSYGELRDTFLQIGDMEQIQAVILTGAGGNFCSGGDVHEIIGPLTEMNRQQLNDFTKMTGDLIIAMISCPKVIIAAIDGVCVGAGAAMAMAADFRYGTPGSKVAFLFVRVGLAGCDMGACSILPRLIGHGRAAELLYTGRSLPGEEAMAWGFYNRLIQSGELMQEAERLAATIAGGPTFAHSMTKKMLRQEWDMGMIEAIEAEARAQAICMETQDFHRAYHAFLNKSKPRFEGN